MSGMRGCGKRASGFARVLGLVCLGLLGLVPSNEPLVAEGYDEGLRTSSMRPGKMLRKPGSTWTAGN